MGIQNDFGFPFTDISGDRKYNSQTWRDYFASIFYDGIIQGQLNDLKVKPQGTPNKTVYVDTGAVIIAGAIRIMVNTTTLACSDNTSGNPRIDRIVVKMDYANRTISFAVKQGTPAASPAAPTLQRDSNIWELALADITLANGYSTITAGVITDKRMDESVCGYSKTAYMQTFDDENNLLKYNRDVITIDGSGWPTDIRFTRPGGNLFLKRVMTNADANGFYQTITETFYKTDGTTVYKTIVYTLTYYANGLVDTCTRVVT